MKKNTATILIVLVLAIAAVALFASYRPENSPISNETEQNIPKTITVEGVWECLPHRDTSGPQTMECAFGVKSDGAGLHYAISTELMSSYPADFPSGAHVHIEGVMVPADQLSSDIWQKYPIEGIISATLIRQI